MTKLEPPHYNPIASVRAKLTLERASLLKEASENEAAAASLRAAAEQIGRDLAEMDRIVGQDWGNG